MTSFYIQIKDLTMYSHSFFITGLIIAKSERKMLVSRQNGSSSGVITFTVRDTKDHFINCTVWGTDYYIENCDRAYKVGYVIAIYQPKVAQKNANSVYSPRTSSPFELTLSEGKSFIHRATEHFEHLVELKNHPIKPTSLALYLSDLYITPDENSLNVDLVVMVRGVEPARQVQTTSGQKTARRVFLMDKTMESMSMTVWHSDYQQLMDHWVPLTTVLHLVDVQVKYSGFERSMVLGVTSKTIIVENPVQSSRSIELMSYIHSLSEAKIESLKVIQLGTSTDAASIKDVLTIKRILDQIERDPSKEIATIVIGVITKFDINSSIIKCCVHCKRFIQRNRNGCEYANCNVVGTDGSQVFDRIYLAISLADHSGTLNCRIIDENAEQILGHTAQSLKLLTEDELDAIFNRFILERFAIKVLIRPKSPKEYFASVLDIEKMPSDHMATALKL